MVYQQFSKRFQPIVITISMIVSLMILPGFTPAGILQTETAEDNTIQGTVLVDGDPASPVENARVVAWQENITRTANTAPDGTYSLKVSGGDWQVTVKPWKKNLVSPQWIFTDEPTTVSFNGNPGDPSSQQVNLSVSPAPAQIIGNVLPPAGAGSLASPNRVWVRAYNMEGDGNIVQADPVTGAFTLYVLPGNTQVHLTLENQSWMPPETLAGSIWTTSADTPTDAGDLQLLAKNAVVSGKVTDMKDGKGVANIPVRAWRVDQSEVAATTSDAEGNYTLPVISGEWRIRAVPLPESPYVSAQVPVRISLPDDGALVQNLEVVLTDAYIQGNLLDDATGTTPDMDRGRVYPVYLKNGKWTQFGQGAAVKDGKYSLKVSTLIAASYRLRASFPPKAGISLLDNPVVENLAQGETRQVDLPVIANNSTISGHFNDHDTGDPWTGYPGIVYAGAPQTGALTRARLNPLSGAYNLSLASTDKNGTGGTVWRLHAFVDPKYGYIVQHPRNRRVFLAYNGGEGEDKVVDFTVAKINASVQGVVFNPQGQPLRGAKISVQETSAPAGEAFTRWVTTNSLGQYHLDLTDGSYRVTARYRNWISPLPQTITLAEDEHLTLDLNFRERNYDISGKVLLNGTGVRALIRGRSSSGASVNLRSNAGGNYVIRVNSGDIWTLTAVGEDLETGKFLESDPLTVDTSTGVISTDNDLILHESADLPDNMIFTFDALEDQAIVLSDGAEVVIPAGSMALEGSITLIAQAKAELWEDGGPQPIRFGYRLLAYDESHVPVGRFSQPVTIRLPFTTGQLAALGITSEQLLPAYWDPGTNSWKPVPGYSVQVDSEGNGWVNISVDHFTDFSLLGADKFLFLPLIFR